MLRREQEQKTQHDFRRVSIWEATLWLTGFAIIFALPYWIGRMSIMFSFYGGLIILTWRLSKALPFLVSIFVALLISSVITIAMISAID